MGRKQGALPGVRRARNVPPPPRLVQDGDLVQHVVGGQAARGGEEDADVTGRLCDGGEVWGGEGAVGGRC